MYVCLWVQAGVRLALIPIPVKMSGACDENKMIKTLSFGKIVRGCDASVRVTEDGYLYAVDLAVVVTGADNNYAGQVKIQRKFVTQNTLKDLPIHEKVLSENSHS
jgi:hypothetical protein